MHRLLIRPIHICYIQCSKMPKKQSKPKSKEKPANENAITAENSAVFLNKKGVINIKILAKPGSKLNSIQGISNEEGVGVQIAAPPVDGDANTELIRYMSKVFGVRKSDISLERGSRSRNKVIEVASSDETVQTILDKLQKEMLNS